MSLKYKVTNKFYFSLQNLTFKEYVWGYTDRMMQSLFFTEGFGLLKEVISQKFFETPNKFNSHPHFRELA